MAATMVPARDLRPDVLPTERLGRTGIPIPEIRGDLRRISDLRSVATVVGCLAQSVGLLFLVLWLNNPVAYVVGFLLLGRGFALLGIVGHEAAHRLLFNHKRLNDVVGRWLIGALSFTPNDLYRRSHMSHHRDELGPNEPDTAFYRGYPMARSSVRRKLVRDAFFVSGWKNLKPLLKTVRSAGARKVAAPIYLAQGLLFLALVLTGHWWAYFVLWLAPWMTVWRVLNRLRAIAEHGGMERNEDKRATTHVVRQTWLARFWMVPYNTGWHLAHHVDMGVPWRNLPKLHDELVAGGYVTPGLEHRSYTALWRSMVAPS